MSAADWGIPVPSQGMPIVPFAAPFQAQGDAVAKALDSLKTMAFPRYAKRSDLPTTGNVPRQHATVYADSTLANNGDYYWSGTSWVQVPIFTVGKTNINTASTGTQDIVHGLARTPARILTQTYGPRTAADSSTRITDISATTFTVAWYYNSGLWGSQNNSDHGIYWKAEA